MNFPQQISYVIQQGDNLYNLAQYYHTTVPMILSLNPNIDPYNLQTGSKLIISPGEGFIMVQNNPNPPSCPNLSMQIALINRMRLVWSQHVYWTRMLLISIAEKLNDMNDVANRLMQNPDDIADVFANYYSANSVNSIAQLLAEHLQIGGNFITALRDGKTADANNLDRQWYINADKIVDVFSSINPYFNREELRTIFRTHLDLTKQVVTMRLAKNYPADIEAFDMVENEAMKMADYFSSGIIRQFPQKF